MIKRDWKFILVCLSIMISCNRQQTVHTDKILVITGGHDFEPSFYKIYDSFKNLDYDTITQPDFNDKLGNGSLDQYDAYIFYDMWQDISDAQKKAYIERLEMGQGMVFLHHSLVSYQHWDEFEKIIGGKYIEKDFYDEPDMRGSTYTEDITLEIGVADKDHPVTKDIADFTIYDEGYQFIRMNSGVHPLLSTSHLDCASTVAWTNRYGNSKIVYILLGHGRPSYENENYRKLIRNAISWVGEKE